MLEEIWSLAKARLFVFMSLLQREKVDFAKQKTDEVSVISNLGFNKSTCAYFLVQARKNFTGAFVLLCS